MKEANVIVEKSYAFALEVMRIAKMIRDLREYDLASQLWRAGTSIGSNVEEVQAAQSRADFRSKMSIAAKEAGNLTTGCGLHEMAKSSPKAKWLR